MYCNNLLKHNFTWVFPFSTTLNFIFDNFSHNSYFAYPDY